LEVALHRNENFPKILKTVLEENLGLILEEARTVVCGGAGIGSVDGFELLDELADILEAVVGTTRVPCEEGWKPWSLQIGQSGKTIAPDTYIGIGVSGAPQHIAGCIASKTIFAINKDPDAPIFDIADFAVVADYREVVPLLIQEYKKLKQ
jgi:electron transfer flavoprotein alpha subunit